MAAFASPPAHSVYVHTPHLTSNLQVVETRTGSFTTDSTNH